MMTGNGQVMKCVLRFGEMTDIPGKLFGLFLSISTLLYFNSLYMVFLERKLGNQKQEFEILFSSMIPSIPFLYPYLASYTNSYKHTYLHINEMFFFPLPVVMVVVSIFIFHSVQISLA